jgi:hypothetical protein
MAVGGQLIQPPPPITLQFAGPPTVHPITFMHGPVTTTWHKQLVQQVIGRPCTTCSGTLLVTTCCHVATHLACCGCACWGPAMQLRVGHEGPGDRQRGRGRGACCVGRSAGRRATHVSGFWCRGMNCLLGADKGLGYSVTRPPGLLAAMLLLLSIPYIMGARHQSLPSSAEIAIA